MIQLSILFATAVLLAGCATTPPPQITAANPASTDAPEAATKTARSSLQADEATQRTRELLKQREEQATAAESTAAMSPGNQGHEHH